MMLRASTLIAGLTGGATPRNQFGAKAVQICKAGRMTWAKDPFFLRNAPHTIENPAPKQIAVRIAFGRLAKEAKAAGVTKQFYKGYPGAAGYIQEHKMDIRTAAQAYPSKVSGRKSFHTLEELEEMLEKQRGEIATAPARF